MRSFLMATIIVAGCAIGNAQTPDFDRYQTLLPQGRIPTDFTEHSSVKFTEQVDRMAGDKARVRKAKKKFYLESSFNVDDFLTSGKVLFNDEVSLYLRSVLTEILIQHPDVRRKTRIYAVKSPVVNALTTNNGIIFVNLGLLARLDNEAQLAFILSHEVVHYQKQHVINNYVTNVQIDNARGDYRKLSLDDKQYTKSSYSKELEAEADLLGADIYEKSTYVKDQVPSVFDILRTADFPLTWVNFDKTLFESKSYIFPDSVKLSAIEEVTIDDDYDDSKSTHPNIKKRKDAMLVKIGKATPSGTKYIISKELFERVRKIARYELCRMHLLSGSYAEALALALSLQPDNPKSYYLKTTIAKAWYGLARKSSVGSDHINYKEWMGQGQRVAYFIQHQSTYELNVLAIRQLNHCLELDPANEEISLMLNDIIQSLARKETDLDKKFIRSSTARPIADLKYPYTQYAFLDFKDATSFFQAFDKQVSLVKIESENEERIHKRRRSGQRVKRKEIDKVVINSSMYWKIDNRKKNKVQYIDAENVLVGLSDKIERAADQLNMGIDVVNTTNITSADVNVMRSNSIMNEWLAERFRAEDEKMVSSIHNEMMALATKAKTEHFVWMGGMSIIVKKRMKGYIIALGILLPPMIPFSLAYLLSSQRKTMYFALVFNVRTEELEFADMRQMSMRDNASLMQSNIYYTLFKLKKP